MRRILFGATLLVLLAAAWRPVAAQHRHHGHHGGGGFGGFGGRLERGQSIWWLNVSYPWAGGLYTSGFRDGWYPSTSSFGYFISLSPVVTVPQTVNVAPVPVNQGVFAPAPAALPADDAPPPAQPKATNADQKALAGRFLSFGDEQFRKQKFLAALGRYKTALRAAPDMPEVYFRQALTYVALGKYESAATAYRRGLRIRGNWPAAPFALDQLYGDAVIAKTGHIEELAKAVELNPHDADLMLLLGMQLLFDGQRDRAEPFFTRSAQLGGNEDQLLNGLLPQPKPADAPPGKAPL